MKIYCEHDNCNSTAHLIAGHDTSFADEHTYAMTWICDANPDHRGPHGAPMPPIMGKTYGEK